MIWMVPVHLWDVDDDELVTQEYKHMKAEEKAKLEGKAAH